MKLNYLWLVFLYFSGIFYFSDGHIFSYAACLRRTVQHKRFIREKITRKMCSGCLCFYSVQSRLHFFFSHYPTYISSLNIKTYISVILTLALYVSYLSLREAQRMRLGVFLGSEYSGCGLQGHENAVVRQCKWKQTVPSNRLYSPTRYDPEKEHEVLIGF
jgi:hypothetical protein